MYISVAKTAAAGFPCIRSQVDRILDLANHLPTPDRVLLRSVYDRGMSASELAQAVGVRPRTVRRRVRRLVQRVSSPAFTFIVRAEHAWPHRRRLIGHLFFLQGRTQRAVAARLGMSVHQVRREIDHIRGLMDQASSGPDGGR